MKDEELKELIVKIRKESTNLFEMLNIIEVSQNSVKRDRLSKKNKFTYPDFMKAYRASRNSIMLYPIYVNVMESIICEKPGIKKKYEKALDEVMQELERLVNIEKEKLNTASPGEEANKMSALLQNMREKKGEEDETGKADKR